MLRTDVRQPYNIAGRFGGSANIDAFTEMRWVTMRSEIALYPF